MVLAEATQTKQQHRRNPEMTEVTSNAMDNIEVRPLTFDCAKIENNNPVWSRSHPLFSIYINALGIHVPYFERFLVVGLRKVKKQIENARLAKDVSRIIGQEAHHAKNFVAVNQFLAERYPQVTDLDARAKAYFEDALENGELKSTLGYIAGYETFTYLGGMIILKNYDKWMKDADPVLRSAWLWHQVEEVEHGAVAFDVFRYFFPDSEWYRKWMIIKAFIHIGRETWAAYRPMVKKEGFFRNPLKAARALGFFVKFSALLAKSALPTLSRNYHPRNHPMCSTMQSPVAVSWTKFYSSGNDVLALDNRQMDEMLNAY